MLNTSKWNKENYYTFSVAVPKWMREYIEARADELHMKKATYIKWLIYEDLWPQTPNDIEKKPEDRETQNGNENGHSEKVD